MCHPFVYRFQGNVIVVLACSEQLVSLDSPAVK
jgi:hypothetical protein